MAILQQICSNFRRVSCFIFSLCGSAVRLCFLPLFYLCDFCRRLANWVFNGLSDQLGIAAVDDSPCCRKRRRSKRGMSGRKGRKRKASKGGKQTGAGSNKKLDEDSKQTKVDDFFTPLGKSKKTKTSKNASDHPSNETKMKSSEFDKGPSSSRSISSEDEKLTPVQPSNATPKREVKNKDEFDGEKLDVCTVPNNDTELEQNATGSVRRQRQHKANGSTQSKTSGSGAGGSGAGASGAGPSKAGESRAGASGAGASGAGPSRAGGSGAGASGTGASKASESRAGGSGAGGSGAGASGTGASKAGKSRAGDSRAGDSRAGASGAGPSRAGASRAGASKAGASKAGASKAGESRTGDSRAGGPRPDKRQDHHTAVSSHGKEHAISDSESDSSADTQPVTSYNPSTSARQYPQRHLSPRRQQSSGTSPSAWSARDLEAYRSGYPDKRDNESLNDNLKFYSNEIPSKPRGASIDVMHKHWFGNYSLLEEHHGYIQWLFPIREQGMNWQAQELQPHEAKVISLDPKLRERVMKSYGMMLHFWGICLEDQSTGRVVRGNNWEERFRHLNRSQHNYLRITRMLKSLGELGYEHLKFPFLKFVLKEAIKEKVLAQAQRSCLQYWIHTLRDDEEHRAVQECAKDLLAKYGQR